MKQVTLWTDGGAKPNPGKGYGSYAFDHRHETFQLGDNVTNNESEYAALIAGLCAIAEAYDPLALYLTVKTDSALLVGHLQGGWKVRAWNLLPLWAKAKELLAAFGAWRLVKVPKAEIVAVLGH